MYRLIILVKEGRELLGYYDLEDKEGDIPLYIDSRSKLDIPSWRNLNENDLNLPQQEDTDYGMLSPEAFTMMENSQETWTRAGIEMAALHTGRSSGARLSIECVFPSSDDELVIDSSDDHSNRIQDPRRSIFSSSLASNMNLTREEEEFEFKEQFKILLSVLDMSLAQEPVTLEELSVIYPMATTHDVEYMRKITTQDLDAETFRTLFLDEDDRFDIECLREVTRTIREIKSMREKNFQEGLKDVMGMVEGPLGGKVSLDELQAVAPKEEVEIFVDFVNKPTLEELNKAFYNKPRNSGSIEEFRDVLSKVKSRRHNMEDFDAEWTDLQNYIDDNIDGRVSLDEIKLYYPQDSAKVLDLVTNLESEDELKEMFAEEDGTYNVLKCIEVRKGLEECVNRKLEHAQSYMEEDRFDSALQEMLSYLKMNTYFLSKEDINEIIVEHAKEPDIYLKLISHDIQEMEFQEAKTLFRTEDGGLGTDVVRNMHDAFVERASSNRLRDSQFVDNIKALHDLLEDNAIHSLDSKTLLQLNPDHREQFQKVIEFNAEMSVEELTTLFTKDDVKDYEGLEIFLTKLQEDRSKQNKLLDKELASVIAFACDKAKKWNIHEQALKQMYQDKGKTQDFSPKYMQILTGEKEELLERLEREPDSLRMLFTNKSGIPRLWLIKDFHKMLKEIVDMRDLNDTDEQRALEREFEAQLQAFVTSLCSDPKQSSITLNHARKMYPKSGAHLLRLVDTNKDGKISVNELKGFYTLPNGKFNFHGLEQLINAFEQLQLRNAIQERSMEKRQSMHNIVNENKKIRESIIRLREANNLGKIGERLRQYNNAISLEMQTASLPSVAPASHTERDSIESSNSDLFGGLDNLNKGIILPDATSRHPDSESVQERLTSVPEREENSKSNSKDSSERESKNVERSDEEDEQKELNLSEQTPQNDFGSIQSLFNKDAMLEVFTDLDASSSGGDTPKSRDIKWQRYKIKKSPRIDLQSRVSDMKKDPSLSPTNELGRVVFTDLDTASSGGDTPKSPDVKWQKYKLRKSSSIDPHSGIVAKNMKRFARGVTKNGSLSPTMFLETTEESEIEEIFGGRSAFDDQVSSGEEAGGDDVSKVKSPDVKWVRYKAKKTPSIDSQSGIVADKMKMFQCGNNNKLSALAELSDMAQIPEIEADVSYKEKIQEVYPEKGTFKDRKKMFEKFESTDTKRSPMSKKASRRKPKKNTRKRDPATSPGVKRDPAIMGSPPPNQDDDHEHMTSEDSSTDSEEERIERNILSGNIDSEEEEGEEEAEEEEEKRKLPSQISSRISLPLSLSSGMLADDDDSSTGSETNKELNRKIKDTQSYYDNPTTISMSTIPEDGSDEEFDTGKPAELFRTLRKGRHHVGSQPDFELAEQTLEEVEEEIAVSLGPLDGIWTSDGDNAFSIEGNTITWHNGETSDISWNEDYSEVELSMDKEKYHGRSNRMEIVWDDEERWNKLVYI